MLYISLSGQERHARNIPGAAAAFSASVSVESQLYLVGFRWNCQRHHDRNATIDHPAAA
jgi:hypothetical protein